MGLLFNVFLYCHTTMGKMIRPVLLIATREKKQAVPPVTNDLLKISAKKLAAMIRNKEITSVELCEAYITRIKEVNPLINAVTEDRFEAAITEAKAVDDYLSKCPLSKVELEKTKPLLGVPVTIKESCGLKGMEYSVGRSQRAGIKADQDGHVVGLIKATGAIPLLVSTASELCWSISSDNMTTGKTNNPYDITRTPGGSSSGEGALLGAGASVIGIGSDLAGSIRYPACYNGIFGHKTSPNIVNLDGHFPKIAFGSLQNYVAIAPLVRYAEDLKLILDIIVLPEEKPKLKLNEKVDLETLEIYYMDDFDDFALPLADSEVKRAVSSAAKYLHEKCGSSIFKKQIPELKEAFQICIEQLLNSKDMVVGANALPRVETAWLKKILGRPEYSTSIFLFLIQRKLITSLLPSQKNILAKNKKSLWEFLGDNKVILFPTSNSCANKHIECLIDGPKIGYTLFVNCYELTATSIPCGLNTEGMPIGIQVIAGPYQDRLCLAVAEQLEKCFGGWISPQ